MSNLIASAAETRTRYWPVPTPQHGAGAAPPRGPCSTRTIVSLRYIRNQNLFPDRTRVNFIYAQGAQQLSRASREDLHLQQDTPCSIPEPLGYSNADGKTTYDNGQMDFLDLCDSPFALEYKITQSGWTPGVI